MSHINSKERRERKRDEAKKRQEAYDRLPLDRKIEFAGKKQAAKLMKLKETA